jgi:perosamine synthetase
MTNLEIPLSRPDLADADTAAVLDVLQTPSLALGPKLPEFERLVAEYVGCRYGVAVNSGTSALHLIVRSLGIAEGDEVITTPFSFVASANCLLYERARPVFVDIDQETLNINCDLIEAAITPRTQGILAVDVFGRPADWNRLRETAQRRGLALIEDSCEALGARYMLANGRWVMAGSLADAGAFAFYPNKQITTGEGGMVVTDREDVARLCRSMRNQGRDEDAGWLQHARLGYNYRLSDINCALGISQMSRIEEILAARRQIASWYAELLADVPEVEAPRGAPDVEISWFVYVVRLREGFTREQRDRILEGLRARGIGCGNYFSPIHLQPFYQSMFGYREGDFPVTESIASRTIALPFFTRLTWGQVVTVTAALREEIARLHCRQRYRRREARPMSQTPKEQ